MYCIVTQTLYWANISFLLVDQCLEASLNSWIILVYNQPPSSPFFLPGGYVKLYFSITWKSEDNITYHTRLIPHTKHYPFIFVATTTVNPKISEVVHTLIFRQMLSSIHQHFPLLLYFLHPQPQRPITHPIFWTIYWNRTYVPFRPWPR